MIFTKSTQLFTEQECKHLQSQSKLKVSTLTSKTFEIQNARERRNTIKNSSLLYCMFRLAKATVSPYTVQPHVYSALLFCAVGQTNTNNELRSRGVTSVHPVVIDVKGALSPASEPTSLCLPIALHATQPAQYLLRHLQSNLGWQAQMAPLIQVNYLWTFQSKQTCHSPEVCTLLDIKKGGVCMRAVYVRAHACTCATQESV